MKRVTTTMKSLRYTSQTKMRLSIPGIGKLRMRYCYRRKTKRMKMKTRMKKTEMKKMKRYVHGDFPQ